MRDDMKKVLVTTPRVNSSIKNGEVRYLRRQRVYEDYEGPSYSSMKPSHKTHCDRKYLNEYLNPLFRYLESQCGRPWSLIYSEIKKKNPNGSAVSEHIYQHLFVYVELNPVFKNKKVYNHTGHYQLYCSSNFYVNRAGILLQPKAARIRWSRAADGDGFITINDETILIKRESDSVWFMITYQEPVDILVKYWNNSAGKFTEYVRKDNPGLVKIKGIELPRLCGKYPCSSKTLSKKEKKKYKIL